MLLIISELGLSDKVNASIMAAGMFLPSLAYRFTFPLAMFMLIFDYLSDWLTTGKVSYDHLISIFT